MDTRTRTLFVVTAALWGTYLHHLIGGLSYDPARGYAPSGDTMLWAVVWALPVVMPVALPLRNRVLSLLLLGASCLFLLLAVVMLVGMVVVTWFGGFMPPWPVAVFFACLEYRPARDRH